MQYRLAITRVDGNKISDAEIDGQRRNHGHRRHLREVFEARGNLAADIQAIPSILYSKYIPAYAYERRAYETGIETSQKSLDATLSWQKHNCH